MDFIASGPVFALFGLGMGHVDPHGAGLGLQLLIGDFYVSLYVEK